MSGPVAGWRAIAAVARSLRLYRGRAAPRRAMDALYGRFLSPGDLAFDIGAHVGDRTASFRRLGARVIALEPQPVFARALRLLHGRDKAVRIVEAAVGAAPGRATLRVNTRNPTVSSASPDFVAAAQGQPGWRGQVWDAEIAVDVVTLDGLLAAHGLPSFAKIDVEGFEAAVLAGLSRPLPALSFEFTTIQREVAIQCLERLDALGPYGFDVALGESQTLAFGRWIGAAEMAAHLAGLPHAANSGDVYAALPGSRARPATR